VQRFTLPLYPADPLTQIKEVAGQVNGKVLKLTCLAHIEALSGAENKQCVFNFVGQRCDYLDRVLL